ncbi:antimicrobial peptide resistance and lipid A acylation protein PagP [Biostraticola tofi]|uniref:Lipid A acyltransferase PagP n=1 Tax=Biostraticola tofi TaxID=466109 RepID=A0A4R3Z7S2_9GAMM|nr:antimicrobial peptide resistance and lipid A acylation protein PagP [Biostraticola tofi]
MQLCRFWQCLVFTAFFALCDAQALESAPVAAHQPIGKIDQPSAASRPTPGGIWQSLVSNVQETWQHSPQRDLYLPVITWHNRFTYDNDHIKRYNERPWGAGYGISRHDENGDWHGIYLMAFKDSFNHWEPFGGYAWEKQWYPSANKKFRLGAGYTAGFTLRENWKYLPVPAVLPLASVSYGDLTFQATYIPGSYNNGNVFFGWLRWSF